MIKKLSIAIILVISAQILFAANDSTMVHSPRQVSVEIGYRNVFSMIDRSQTPLVNNATNGVAGLVDFGWKVSGLNGKKPAIYITVPLGYANIWAADNTSENITMLYYGWTIRHELTKKPQLFTPFVGYGLLLNTLKINGTEGGIMGHQTQFEAGTNLNTRTRLKYYIKADYSYASYPKLNDSKRIHYQFIDIAFGVRF